MIKRAPLVARENDSTNDLPNLPEEETNADSSDNIPLANHEKFAQRIPYTSKYGRKITFAETNQIKYIEKYGKSRPVPRR